MYNDLLISSVESLSGQKVYLKIEGFMEISANISNFSYTLEEDICTIKGDDEFILAFNVNQISNLINSRNVFKIFIDLDLSITLEKK